MISISNNINLLNSIGENYTIQTNQLFRKKAEPEVQKSFFLTPESSIKNNTEPETLANLYRTLVTTDKEYKKDPRLSAEAQYDVQYPTGFLDLDYHLGQKIDIYDMNGIKTASYDSIGLVDGSVNMIVGRSGCGKSTLAKQIAGNIVRPFKQSSIFEDSIEGGITNKRNEVLLNMHSEEAHSRLVMRNTGVTSEAFFKRIKVIHDIKCSNPEKYQYDTGKKDSMGNPIIKFVPDVYILDSLAVLVPEKMAEEEELSGQMSQTAAAKVLARIFRALVTLCKEANIILLVINHITDDVSINPMQKKKAQNIYLDQGETTPGGRTPFYLCNNVFRLEDSRKSKEIEALGITGVFVDICILKSRTSIAKRDPACTLIFEQSMGFNPVLSLLISLKDYNMIGGAGAYLYLLGHDDIKFSQKKFQSILMENPDFYNAFISTCCEIFSNALHSREESEYSVFDTVKMNMDIINMITNKQAL